MRINIQYKTIRFFRLLLGIIVSTLFFLSFYWVVSLFYPEFNHISIALIYVFVISITLFFVSNDSSQIQRWYENQLSSSRELFGTLYDQSPVPYITLDSDGKIKICNKATGFLFKTESSGLIGKKFNSLLTHDDSDKFSIILGTIQAGTSLPQTEVKIVVSESETVWVNLSIFHSARLNQRLVSLVDINNQKIVDKAKSEFVSLATHQLRTPITAIKWNLDLLKRSVEGQLNDKQAEYLLKASRNVTRMIALINDFLSVSKLETGTFSTVATSVRLANFLQSVIDEYQQTIEEKQISVVTSFLPPELTITTDENLFHIITSNLLSNAVKYTRPSAEISISYTQKEDTFVLMIADSGIGVPAHELGDLFKKFFRASNAQLHRTEGTGLGLYIVKESVEKLGGRIEVESSENVGTLFTLTFPLHQNSQ